MNKIFKNILLVIGFVFCLGLGTNNVFAKDVNIILNDQKVSLGSDAVIEKGRVLVKLREIYKMKKYEVLQDEDRGIVKIKAGFRYIQFVVGLDKVIINNKEGYIDVKPVIIGNKTYIPLRIFEEALGNKVFWDKERNVVIISEDEKDIEFNFKEEILAKKLATDYYNENVIFVERTILGQDECYVFAKSRHKVPSIAIEKNGNKIYLIKENYHVYKILGTITFND